MASNDTELAYYIEQELKILLPLHGEEARGKTVLPATTTDCRENADRRLQSA